MFFSVSLHVSKTSNTLPGYLDNFPAAATFFILESSSSLVYPPNNSIFIVFFSLNFILFVFSIKIYITRKCIIQEQKNIIKIIKKIDKKF